MSVTLTALKSLPSSSTTAMVLTPSSLMSFIASRTVSLAFAAMTLKYRYIDGRASELKGLVRNRRKVGEDWLNVVNHDSSCLSDTMPRKFEVVSEWMST